MKPAISTAGDAAGRRNRKPRGYKTERENREKSKRAPGNVPLEFWVYL